MDVPKTIEFNGVTYHLMGGKRRYYLSQSTTNHGRKHPKGLHVAIWEFHNSQEVPPGCEIHHLDDDTFNNDPSNLECLPLREHRKITFRTPSEAHLRHLESIRPLAAAWHASYEGREWHKQHGKNVFGDRPAVTAICVECGAEFSTVNTYSRYCSGQCGDRARHHTAKQESETTATCVICGITFLTRIYRRGAPYRKTCSHSCRGRLARQTRRTA